MGYYKHDNSIPTEKNCLVCNTVFSKTPKYTWSDFKIKKFCSYKCYWVNKKGALLSPLAQTQLNKLIEEGRLRGGWHKGHKHSLEERKRMSERMKGKSPANKGKPSPMRGDKHPSWKGGSSLSDRLRSSYKNQEWIRSVFVRDNYTCVKCDARSVKGKKVILNADHIIPFAYYLNNIKNNFADIDWYETALKYEPLWDIKNGRTLCKPCHKLTETYAGGAKKFELIN